MSEEIYNFCQTKVYFKIISAKIERVTNPPLVERLPLFVNFISDSKSGYIRFLLFIPFTKSSLKTVTSYYVERNNITAIKKSIAKIL